MNCLYCGRKIPLLRKLSDSEFCSAEHRQAFRDQESQLALSVLLEARERLDRVSQAAPTPPERPQPAAALPFAPVVRDDARAHLPRRIGVPIGPYLIDFIGMEKRIPASCLELAPSLDDAASPAPEPLPVPAALVPTDTLPAPCPTPPRRSFPAPAPILSLHPSRTAPPFPRAQAPLLTAASLLDLTPSLPIAVDTGLKALAASLSFATRPVPLRESALDVLTTSAPLTATQVSPPAPVALPTIKHLPPFRSWTSLPCAAGRVRLVRVRFALLPLESEPDPATDRPEAQTASVQPPPVPAACSDLRFLRDPFPSSQTFTLRVSTAAALVPAPLRLLPSRLATPPPCSLALAPRTALPETQTARTRVPLEPTPLRHLPPPAPCPAAAPRRLPPHAPDLVAGIRPMALLVLGSQAAQRPHKSSRPFAATPLLSVAALHRPRLSVNLPDRVLPNETLRPLATNLPDPPPNAPVRPLSAHPLFAAPSPRLPSASLALAPIPLQPDPQPVLAVQTAAVQSNEPHAPSPQDALPVAPPIGAPPLSTRLRALTGGVRADRPRHPGRLWSESAHGLWRDTADRKPAPPRSRLALLDGMPLLPPLPRGARWSNRPWLNSLAPRLPRTAALAAIAIFLAVGLYSFWPAPPNNSVSASTSVAPPHADSAWGGLRNRIMQRAAISLEDDFRAGLGSWQGGDGWARSWKYEQAGFVEPGQLALFKPAAGMDDYSFSLLAQIGRRSLNWAFRARDERNYYAMRIVITRPGPRPEAAVVRYAVIDGREEKPVTLPLPFPIHNDMLCQVRMEVRGDTFTTYLQGQIVDTFTDNRLKSGGVGLFSPKGDNALFRRISVAHQDDYLGKLCALLAPPRNPAGEPANQSQHSPAEINPDAKRRNQP